MKQPKKLNDAEIKDAVEGLRKGKYMPLDTEEKMKIGAGLLFMCKDLAKTVDTKRVHMVLGDTSTQLGSRFVNGIPMMSSFKLIDKEDWNIIVDTYNASKEYEIIRR